MNVKLIIISIILIIIILVLSLNTGLDIGDGVTECAEGDFIKNVNGIWACFTPIYAEMWNYTSGGAGWTFLIAEAGDYHNLTGLVAGDINGFSFISETQENGGSYLTAELAGLYQMSFTMSFRSVANGGLFGISVSHNFNVSKNRDCYSRREAITSVGNVGINCLMDLSIGDKVNIQIENENTNRNIVIHTANLNLYKIND